MSQKFQLKLLSILPQFIYKRIVIKYFNDGKKSFIFEDVISNKSSILKNLFDGDSKLFTEYLESSAVYGEYGCGVSSVYAINFAEKATISVDTDSTWVEKVKKVVKYNSLLDISTVNLGEASIWGKPESYAFRENIKQYLNYIWSQKIKPDFVLIDGRFRVAAFLTTLKNANKGTIICFDDYVMRPIYHIVEEFETPLRHNSRQAIFCVNKNYDIKQLDFYIEKFEFVFD
jgi:hypothetical protein